MMARRTRSPWPDRIAVGKDLTLFVIGSALIVWQGFAVPPRDFNLSAMIFGGVVAGVPGAIHLWQLRASPPSTDGLPSEDHPQQSLLPSSPPLSSE